MKRDSALTSPYINRELSWLMFNERVLQEANDPSNPLIEQLRFLGIFSNNLDEFFRVRYAVVRRLAMLGVGAADMHAGIPPHTLLKEIQQTVLDQQKAYENIYSSIIDRLKKYKIFTVDEHGMDEQQKQFASQYFEEKLSPTIVPIMLNHIKKFPELRDQSIYLAVLLAHGNQEEYALIEIPTEIHGRFIQLPSRGRERYIIFLDDLMRYALERIFAIFSFDKIEAYTFKFTRDAELDIDTDLSRSFIDKIARSVQQRKKGEPVRFVYDKSMPKGLLKFLMKGLHLDSDSDSLIAGGRYHNKRDFMDFPNVGGPYLEFPKQKPQIFPDLEEPSILDVIAVKDVMLHFPYQSYNYVIRLLREAAIDPTVTTLRVTLYRAAKKSQFLNALINAVRNGKKVTVVIELQARFDEENNIRWTNKLQEEGVEVIYGVPGLKVHSKLILITREVAGVKQRFTAISTGNFNESTARVYCDLMLFTSNSQITDEVNKVFKFFRNNYKVPSYKHLIVSPHYTRSFFYERIEREIALAQSGQPAFLHFKCNSIVDNAIIDKLYESSRAGVQVRLSVRGICSLRTGVPGLSENIEAISILGKYLEHARIYIFGNAGDPEVYISSADLMNRNLDTRVEVTCPIYDARIKKHILELFNREWKDNVKARRLDDGVQNSYRTRNPRNPKFHTQADFTAYYTEIATS